MTDGHVYCDWKHLTHYSIWKCHSHDDKCRFFTVFSLGECFPRSFSLPFFPDCVSVSPLVFPLPARLCCVSTSINFQPLLLRSESRSHSLAQGSYAKNREEENFQRGSRRTLEAVPYSWLDVRLAQFLTFASLSFWQHHSTTEAKKVPVGLNYSSVWTKGKKGISESVFYC